MHFCCDILSSRFTHFFHRYFETGLSNEYVWETWVCVRDMPSRDVSRHDGRAGLPFLPLLLRLSSQSLSLRCNKRVTASHFLPLSGRQEEETVGEWGGIKKPGSRANLSQIWTNVEHGDGWSCYILCVYWICRRVSENSSAGFLLGLPSPPPRLGCGPEQPLLLPSPPLLRHCHHGPWGLIDELV